MNIKHKTYFWCRFKPLCAKEIIHDVLFDHLATKSYDAQAAVQWSKDIADNIEKRIKGIIQGHQNQKSFLNTYV